MRKNNNKRKKIGGVKRILIPTDFSPHSDAALDYAIFMADRFQADLTLIHVMEPFPYNALNMIDSVGQENPFRLDAQWALDQKSKKALAKGVSVETHLREGIPYLEIVRMAKKNKVDMIIMGSHGRTGVQRMLMGSVAEKVTRSAPCPVLIIPFAPKARRELPRAKRKAARAA